MKVTVRKKKISKNRFSLYLDYYPPLVDPETKKSTRREFLGLYIFESPKNYQDKQHNKETNLQADLIKASRQRDIQRNTYDFIFKQPKQIDFLKFFKKLADKKWDSDGNHGSWLSAYHHLELFTKGKCETTDMTWNFVKISKIIKKNHHHQKQNQKAFSYSQSAYLADLR